MSAKQNFKLGVKLVNAACAALGQAEDKIQEAAIFCVEHARQYHDVTLAMLLVNGVAEYKAYNALLLKQWFQNHGPFDFEMSDDKKTIENVVEKKDKEGNIAKAYSPHDVLEAAPVTFVPPKATSTKEKPTPTPISFTWVQDQIKKLQKKLDAAIEPDGVGILVGYKNSKPVIARKNNKEYKKFYDAYSTYVKGIMEFSSKVVELPTPALAAEATQVIAKNVQRQAHDVEAQLEPNVKPVKATVPARGQRRRAA